jgi:hypothetical protein
MHFREILCIFENIIITFTKYFIYSILGTYVGTYVRDKA